MQASSEDRTEQRDLGGHLFHNFFEFHRLALRYFKKPAWKQLFSATWMHLEVQLNASVATLGEYKALLQDQARAQELNESRCHITQANTYLAQLLAQASQTRLEAQEAIRKLGADEVVRRRGHVVNWLSAPDAGSDQDHGHAVRKCCPESGKWILDDPRYRRWNDSQAEETPLLWVNAIPGAGKSVLASLIVDESLPLANVMTIFFYFKHDHSEKDTFLAMARSLLHQLSLLDDTLLLYLFEIATRRGENVLKTTKLAKEVLTTCLNATGKVRAVIDGVNECHEKEQKHIVEFWIRHCEEFRSGPNSCRCIMFSQDDASTRPLFATVPAIRIYGEAHNADIRASCTSWGEKIQSKFKLSRQDTRRLVTETADRAQSMFLFANIVMNNLYEQVSQADLFAELNSFPAEIGDAYARVARRVLGHGKLPSQRYAHRLLSWVACAIRPLKWREIQVAISIDNQTGVVDLERKCLRVTLIKLCGALLEESPNGDIDFVHHSAKQYLLDQGYVDRDVEHHRMTELCLGYLALPLFSAQRAESQAYADAVAGTYGFLEYAMACWTTHLEHAIDASRGKGLPGSLVQTLEALFDHHWKDPRKRTKPTKRITQLYDSIANLDVCDRVRDTMSSMHSLMTTNLTDHSAVETLTLFETTVRIRNILERLPQTEQLEHLYGSSLFKCPRIYCKWFSEGFSRAEDRQLHVDKHERSHLCPHRSCLHATLGFPTAKELSRHLDVVHGQMATDDTFPLEQIDFKDLATLRSDVPRPVEIVQAPARSREDSQSGDTSRARTILQCELCSKVFTRTYDLQLHLATHNDERPFSCSVCGACFTGQYVRDDHEKWHRGTRTIHLQWK
ncbi:hypothetical protein CB0940_04886 [Cercospora beticola]|nr:hypothetical protein CB0940_04886 [Cercospora beticola]PIA93282.1 hypothetical protein CB0940_04886 [Cercospora beticola]